MAIVKLEKDGLVFLVYKREGSGDFLEFKHLLDRLSGTADQTSDIALDLTACMTLSEGETSVLVSVVKRFSTTTRRLRVIAKGNIAGKLRNLNLIRAASLVVYESHEAFLKQINRKGILGG